MAFKVFEQIYDVNAFRTPHRIVTILSIIPVKYNSSELSIQVSINVD